MNPIQAAVAIVTSALEHLEPDEAGEVPMERRQAHVNEVLPIVRELSPGEMGEMVFTLGSMTAQALTLVERSDLPLDAREMLREIALRSEESS